MPPVLRLEMKAPDATQWIPIADIHPGERHGVVSNTRPEGADFYVFGVDSASNQGYVRQLEDSKPTGDRSDGREARTLGFLSVVINLGQSYEMTIVTPNRKSRVARFSYIDV